VEQYRHHCSSANKCHDSKEHLNTSNASSAIMMAGAALAKFAMAVGHFGALNCPTLLPVTS